MKSIVKRLKDKEDEDDEGRPVVAFDHGGLRHDIFYYRIVHDASEVVTRDR